MMMVASHFKLGCGRGVLFVFVTLFLLAAFVSDVQGSAAGRSGQNAGSGKPCSLFLEANGLAGELRHHDEKGRSAITPVVWQVPIKGIGNYVANNLAVRRAGSGLEFAVGTVEFKHEQNQQIPRLHIIEGDRGSYKETATVEFPNVPDAVPYTVFSKIAFVDLRPGEPPSIILSTSEELYLVRRGADGLWRPPVLVLRGVDQFAAAAFFNNPPGEIGMIIYDRKGSRSVDYCTITEDGSIRKRKKLIDADPEKNIEGPVFDGMVVSDMDGDGRPDVVVRMLPTIQILRNQGNGSFEAINTNIPGFTNGTIAVSENKKDPRSKQIAVTDATPLIDMPGRFHIYSQDGSLTRWRETFEGTAGDNHPESVAFLDLDGDGYEEVLLPGYDTGSVFYYRSLGQSGFEPEIQTIQVGPGSGPGIPYVRGTHDSDGKPLIVVPSGRAVGIIQFK